MTYRFIKRTAIFTIIVYMFMVFNSNYSFAYESKNVDLSLAQKLYNEHNFRSSFEAVNRFLTSNNYSESLKDDFCLAHLILAKIYFLNGNLDKMKEELRKLYDISPDYQMLSGEYKTIEEEAKKIQDEVLKQLTEKKPETSRVIYPQGETKKPKKKIRWVWVAVGAVAAGVLLYLLLKPKKRTLTVTVGEGVAGDPVSGTHTYKKGAAIKCNYSLKQGYTGLSVKLDGNEVQNGYEFKMYSNHTLEVTARQCTLTVIKGAGINGTPDSGTYTYQNGDIASYNYILQANYTDIIVTSDDVPVNPEGTITMSGPHTLKASATRQYTLNVTRGPGVNGTPITGSYTYKAGDVVSYSYSLQTGYKDLAVTLDGLTVPTTGSITMNGNHNMVVSAQKYKLTVTRGAGVNGYPGPGDSYHLYGAKVDYNYSLQTGYKDLVVRLNGATVYKSGSITMNRDQILTASAVEIDDPPTVSITNPKNGDTVSGSIFIKVDTTDDKGIIGVEFYIDDVLKRSINQTPYQWILDTTKYSNGSHTIKVIAYDTANQTASHEITVTVNN